MDSSFTECANTNTTTTDSSWLGFVYLLGSAALWGSNYIPVKQFETGDGMFFQLINCLAIWMVSLVVNITRGFPQFYALPLLSGLLWATGNVLAVPIIKTIGVGLGILTWSGVSLITGWATPRFGLLGIKAEVPSNVVYNYLGVFLILLATIFNMFIKPEVKKKESTSEARVKISFSANNQIDSTKVIHNYGTAETGTRVHPAEASATSTTVDVIEKEPDFFERMSPQMKRVFGLSLSIISGIFYGQVNTPILYVKDNYPCAPANTLDYLFAFFSGILVVQLAYFAIYCMMMKNKPVVLPNIVLPALVSGLMWGLACVCYYLSVNSLNQSISISINTAGPSIVSNLWGVLVFKEIRGSKNLIILLVGFAVSITGSIFCGLSL